MVDSPLVDATLLANSELALGGVLLLLTLVMILLWYLPPEEGHLGALILEWEHLGAVPYFLVHVVPFMILGAGLAAERFSTLEGDIGWIQAFLLLMAGIVNQLYVTHRDPKKQRTGKLARQVETELSRMPYIYLAVAVCAVTGIF